MIQTLTKNWYLLALCGILQAITSVIYLIMYNAGPDAMPMQGWHAEVMLLSKLLVAAGVCAIVASIWKPREGAPWLLVLNGLALIAYGLIPLVSKGRMSFRPFALLVAVMAMSFGLLALTLARTTQHRHHAADKWLFRSAGAASVAFALAFLVLANGWIQLERRPFHPSLFLWFCLYFGFSAICMLGLALWRLTVGRAFSEANHLSGGPSPITALENKSS